MSAPVDLKHFFDELLGMIERTVGADCDRYRATTEARAAVADAMREMDVIAAGLESDGRTADGMTKATAAKRLRAALARVQGGAK